MYRIGLVQAGFQVEVARSASSLFAALKTPVRAIVMEWEHLGRPGPEIVEVIRGNPNLEDIPILVLTNRDGDLERLKADAIQMGAQDWLVKARTTPWDLAATVSGALDSAA